MSFPENKGIIKNVDRWGKRRLAYEINKKQYGYYVYFRFDVESDNLIELERECKLDNSIILKEILTSSSAI